MTDIRDRGSLQAEIIQDVEQVIDEELADSPFALTDQARRSIRDEIVNYTQRILEALSFDEMRSQGAQALHLANMRSEVQCLIRERRSRKD
jgi:hypothetical protein